MTSEHVIVPISWRRQLAVARLVLATIGLALAIVNVFPAALLYLVLSAVYLTYAFGVLAWKRLQNFPYSLPSLLPDALFVLGWASAPKPEMFWLSLPALTVVLTMMMLLHTWQVTAIAAGSMLLIFAAIHPIQFESLWPTMLTASGLAVIAGLLKRSLQERLSAAFRRAVLSRSEAETARVTERQRIAADFHDGPLQSFISFQMRLEIVRKLLSRDVNTARDELIQLQDLCRQQVTDLRDFVRNMRPAELDAANLTSALRQQVRAFEQDSGLSVTLQVKEFTGPTESESAIEILQIVREGLHNMQKHARASRAFVSIGGTGQTLELVLEDDGRGLPFAGTYTLDELEALRLGPASIKRRVRGMDGSLTLDSRPNRGTVLTIRLPV